MQNIATYTETLATIIYEQSNRMPLWIVDDIVINPDTLKVEAFIVKNSFFKTPMILNSSSVPPWWKDMYVPEYSLKEIKDTVIAKKILEDWIWIIWNKVVNEQWVYIWNVVDMTFSKTTSEWISLIVKKSLFWLIYIWKWIDITKKDIIDIKKDKIIVRDLKFVRG